MSSEIQEMGYRSTPLGVALYIRISRRDGKRMGWSQLWKRFVNAYPGQWALQVFPPKECLVDEVNLYHLFVFEERPPGMGIHQ